jgi:hypothetical protein
VRLVDAPPGVLYVLQSPDFTPRFFRPLEFMAIGSGNEVMQQLDFEADWLFAGDVGNPAIETMALRQCVSNFVHTKNIRSVGGLFPCLRVSAKGTSLHGHSVELPFGGEKIGLQTRAGRWIKVHANSGTEIPLRYPWEIDFSAYTKDHVFDFLKKAEEEFRRPRAVPAAQQPVPADGDGQIAKAGAASRLNREKVPDIRWIPRRQWRRGAVRGTLPLIFASA